MQLKFALLLGGQCLLLVGADRQTRYVSPTITRLLGYSTELFASLSAQELCHPDDLPALEQFIALLMPPQAASIAVGAIRDVPVVSKRAVVVGRRMKVTLSCDHRALDGLMGAQFLKEFKRVLEHPEELLAPVVPS